jgi:hypothetical protein
VGTSGRGAGVCVADVVGNSRTAPTARVAVPLADLPLAPFVPVITNELDGTDSLMADLEPRRIRGGFWFARGRFAGVVWPREVCGLWLLPESGRAGLVVVAEPPFIALPSGFPEGR